MIVLVSPCPGCIVLLEWVPTLACSCESLRFCFALEVGLVMRVAQSAWIGP